MTRTGVCAAVQALNAETTSAESKSAEIGAAKLPSRARNGSPARDGDWREESGDVRKIMPPRIPIVLLFVAVYFAAVIGGDAGAPARPFLAIPIEALGLTGAGETLRLTLGEALALVAASAALLDATWRPARTRWDAFFSFGTAALAIYALWTNADAATSAYGLIAALAIGDALASLRAVFIRPRAQPA